MSKIKTDPIQTEVKRVCDEIESRLIAAISKEYPLALKLIPTPAKQTIRFAIEGAYASGYNHGVQQSQKLEK